MPYQFEFDSRNQILRARFEREATDEDLKEYYFYVDSTPTHSYMKYVYKYPQGEYPYSWLE